MNSGSSLALKYAVSRSRINGISVSATKRPPKMPKRPSSSGPVRSELAPLSDTLELLCAARPRRLDETADELGILDAGRAFDARRHIDAHGMHGAHRRAHIGGRPAP